MPKKQILDTSKEAFHSFNPEDLREIHQKIIKALEVIGNGTYEQISNQMCCEPSKVWRRMNELLKLGLVHRPGEKRPLKSNRMGYVWYLTGKVMAKTDKENKRYKGPGIVDYSRRIQDISKQAKQLDLL